MPQRPKFRAFLRHPAALVVGFFALSCLGDSSGPGVTRPGYFHLAPYFESAAPPGIVPIDRIRVLLFRPGSSAPALDTVAAIAPGDTAVDLSLTVAVFTAADTFTAQLALITPTGDTAFRAGPLTVVGRPAVGAGATPPPPLPVPVAYTGIGANADSVVITVQPASVLTGDTAQFQAVAWDNDAPLPGTPVGWISLDPLRATVPQPAVGKVVGGSQRGAARIVAQLLTGPADTGSVTVQLLPATIGAVSGNNQVAGVRALLSLPIVAELKASDDVPVVGVVVNFAVLFGGGSVSAGSAVTDANGRASVQWTLGPSAGIQSVKASPAKVPAVQATFTATGLAGPVASIAVNGGDAQSATVGTAVATPPSVIVRDADGNPVAGTTVTFTVASGGGSVTGPAPTTDPSGIAAVGSWTLGATAGANSLNASASDSAGFAAPDRALHAPAAVFTVSFTATGTGDPATATQLAFTAQPNNAVAGGAIGVQVTARNAAGSTAVSFTGPVTVAIGANPGDGSLSGTTTVNAVAGVANFTGLSINGPGNGYTLVATAASLSSATSAPFNITPGGGGTVTWASAVGGNWSTPANWTGGVVPGPTDNVEITLAGNYTVTVDMNATMNNLTVGGASGSQILAVTGERTITVNGTGTFSANGRLNLQSGTLAGPGTVTLQGQYDWSDWAQLGTGTTILAASSSGNMTGTQLIGRGITAQGFIAFTGSPTLENGATFTNQGMMELIEDSTGGYWGPGTTPGSLVNTGTMRKNGAGTVQIGVPFTNNGLLRVEEGVLQLNGNGPATTATHAGDFLVDEPGYLMFCSMCVGGGAHTISGTLSGAGAVQLYSDMTFTASSGINLPFISVAGGNITVGGTFAVTDALQITNGRIDFNGATPATLEVLGIAGGIVGGTGIVDINTDLSWTSGVVTGSGTIRIGEGAGGYISLGTVTLVGGHIENAGLLSWIGISHIDGGQGGRIDNLGGATMEISGDVTLGYTTGVPVTINNAGTFNVYGTGTSTLDAVVINNGTMDLQSGTLAITRSFTHADNAILQGIGALDLSDATPVTVAGDLNPGTSPGALAITGNVPLSATATINIELEGTTPGFAYDQLHLTGALGQSGALGVNLAGGFTPVPGDSFAILTYGSRTGSFGSVTLPVVGGLVFDTVTTTGRTPDTLYVTVTGGASPTTHWTSATGGNWSDPNNWSGGVAPTSGDIAAIDLDGSYTVVLDVNATVAALQLGASSGNQTLELTSRTLTLNGASSIGPTGELTLSDATINGSGALTNQGYLLARGNSSLGLGFGNAPGAMLQVQGFAGPGLGQLSVTSSFTNSGEIELTDAGAGYGATLTMNYPLLLTNAPGGVISTLAGANGARTLAFQLDNQGTINIGRATTLARPSSSHTNSGTINVSGGVFTVTQSGTTPSFTNAGTISLASNLSVSGGTLNLVGGTASGAGLLSATGVTLNYASLASMPGTLTLSNVTIPAGLNIPFGESLTLLDGNFAADVANDGTLTIHGNVTLGGAVTTGGSSTLLVEGIAGPGAANLTVTSGFTNFGTIRLTDVGAGYGATLDVTNGTLLNAGGAFIETLPGANGARTLAVQLDNQGALNIGRATALNRGSSVHVNSGTIDVAAGTFTLTQSGTTPSFANTGVINLTGPWTVSGGTLDLTTGSTPGAGLLTISNSTLLYSLASMPGTVTLTSVTIPAGLNIADGESLTLLNGSFTAPVTFDGTLNIHGDVTLGGVLTTSATSVLHIEGIAGPGAGSLTVTNGFTNNGLIRLTDIGAGYGSSLAVTNGTLVNAAGAAIETLLGANGARTLAAQLDNQGTVTMGRATTLNRASSVHTNSGDIDVNSGTFTLTQSGTAPSFTNTAAGVINLTGPWTVNAGTLDLTTGTTAGAGLLTISNSTLLYTLPSMPATVTLTNVTIPAGLNIPVAQTITLLNGNFTAPINNDGTLLIHGDVTLGGPITTGNGSLIRLEGIAGPGAGNLTVTNGFTNTAAIELDDIGAGYGASLAVTNGTLLNAAGGTITALAGANGARTLAAELDNQGTVTLGRAMTLSRASSAHSNSGTIDVNAGTLTLTQTGTAPSFSNTGTINLTGPWTVSGGSLDLSNGTMTGAGLLTVTNSTLLYTLGSMPGTVTLTNVTIPAGLNIPVAQTLTLLNGNFTAPITNDGTLLIHGDVTLGGSITTGSGSLIRMEGIAGPGAGNLTVTNGFNNTATIELTDVGAGYGASLTVTNGELNNSTGAGINVLAGANGARTLAVQLNNQGTVTLGRAVTMNRASSVHTNSGTIDVNAGTFTLTQSGTGPSFINTGTMNLTGPWTVSGGTLDVSSGTTTGAGLLSVSNSTLLYSLASMPGTVTLTNVTIPAGLNIPAGQNLTLLNGNFAAAVDYAGTLNIHGDVTLGGTLTTSSTSLLHIEGIAGPGSGNLTVTNGFTNTGTINLTDVGAGYGASLTVTNGTLANAASGTINALAGANGARTFTAQLDNQGILTLGRAMTMNRGSSAHVNNGTINVNAGTLTVTQSGTTPSFANTGTVNLTGGWTVTGGDLDVSTGTISGAGPFTVTNSTLTYSLASMPGAVTFNNVTIPAGLNIPNGQSLTLLDGNFAAPVSNNGTLLIHGGTTLGGTLTTGTTSLIRMEGVAASGSGTLTVTNGFTNNGAIELTDVGAGYGASLIVTNGSLVNAPSGSLTTLAGANGARTLNADLDNQGLLTIGRASTMNRATPAHRNSGTIDLLATLTVSGGGTFTNMPTPTPGTIRGTGTLNVTGTAFSQAAIIDPGQAGTPGTLTITGNMSFLPTSVVEIDVASAGSYDILAISGSIGANGEFHMDFGYSPGASQPFTPLTYGARTGTFNVTASGGSVAPPTYNATNMVVTTS